MPLRSGGLRSGGSAWLRADDCGRASQRSTVSQLAPAPKRQLASKNGSPQRPSRRGNGGLKMSGGGASGTIPIRRACFRLLPEMAAPALNRARQTGKDRTASACKGIAKQHRCAHLTSSAYAPIAHKRNRPQATAATVATFPEGQQACPSASTPRTPRLTPSIGEQTPYLQRCGRGWWKDAAQEVNLFPIGTRGEALSSSIFGRDGCRPVPLREFAENRGKLRLLEVDAVISFDGPGKR
jgi:hypothetical protein